MRSLLVPGNSTMPSCVGIFNLPALKTCTPSPWCTEHCYALKGRCAWKPVMSACQWRYEMSQKATFQERIILEIKRRTSIKFVRIHITGDFYSKDYVEKWAEVAKSCPDIVFRTNTRRQDLIGCMKDLFPNNVVVRESIDETRKPTGLFPVHAISGTRGSGRFFKCRDDCDACEFRCWFSPEINVVTGKVR